MTPKSPGRPTKYTPEKAEQICNLLNTGNSRRIAYTTAHIDAKTFATWLKRHPDFAVMVEQAEAKAEAFYVKTLARAAKGEVAEIVEETEQDVVHMRRISEGKGCYREEPVVVKVKTRKVITKKEFDWRAAESWLKRRNKADWGDRQDITSDDKALQAPVVVLSGVSMSDL